MALFCKHFSHIIAKSTLSLDRIRYIYNITTVRSVLITGSPGVLCQDTHYGASGMKRQPFLI